MSKPDVTIGTATKRADYLKLVEYVSRGDYIDGSAGTTVLTTADFGRTVIVNSASARQVSLPSVDTPEIGGWFRIVKLGAGNVTVQAADSDTINGGAAGGSIICNVAGETFAYITLRLVSATAWVIESGIGSWNTSANMFLLGYPDGPLLKQIATPATPAAGYNRLYSKADKLLYNLNSDGVETQIPDGMTVIPILSSRRWGGWRARPGSTTPDYVMLAGTIGGSGGAASASGAGVEPAYIEIYTQNLGGHMYGWYASSNSWEATKGSLPDVTFRVRFQTLSSVCCWIGLTDATWTAAGGDPASRHLAIFRFASNTSPNIYSVTKDGTTINPVDSGVAAAAAWTTLRIVAPNANQIDFYINGVLKASHVANLPTAILFPWAAVQTLAAASAYIRVGSFFGSFNG